MGFLIADEDADSDTSSDSPNKESDSTPKKAFDHANGSNTESDGSMNDSSVQIGTSKSEACSSMASTSTTDFPQASTSQTDFSVASTSETGLRKETYHPMPSTSYRQKRTRFEWTPHSSAKLLKRFSKNISSEKAPTMEEVDTFLSNHTEFNTLTQAGAVRAREFIRNKIKKYSKIRKLRGSRRVDFNTPIE